MVNFSRKPVRKVFYVSVNGKALCLICSKSITVLKENNIARCYNLKHKNCVCDVRREKFVALKRGA
jgi:hypothetical protein